MIGLKCKICYKTVRPHTKKIRIAKNSKEFNYLKTLAVDKNQPVKLRKTLNGRVYSAILIPEDEKGNVYVIEIKDELFHLICCSDECRREYEKQKREKRKERAGHNFIISRLLPKIRERCNNKCVSCDSIKNLEVHHVQPLSQEGQAKLNNLILLCKDCHLIVTNKSSSKMEKWLWRKQN